MGEAAPADVTALRRTAELYALGADRRDKALWSSILTEDCVIEGPDFTLTGRDAALASLDFLAASYAATQHRVHNQLVEVHGDSAEGETYSTADHLSRDDTGEHLLSWALRYQDQWRREGGVWRFNRRTLLLDWQETRAIQSGEQS